MKRLLPLLALVLLTTALLTPVLVSAQLEPTTIIDAALQDLTAKLGKPMNRLTANWTWEQVNFPDSSLGCPQPGASYTQVVTKGYIIKIEARDFTGSYEYHSTIGGKVLVLCSAVPAIEDNGTAQPNLTPTAETPTPADAATATATSSTAQAVTLGSPILAYIGADGNVTLTSLNGNVTPVAITGDANRRYDAGSLYPQNDHAYGDLQWSPDGTRLVFTDLLAGVAFVVNSGLTPQAVGTGLPTLIPATFSPDSKEIAYAIPTNQVDNATNTQTLQLQAVTGAGAPPRPVGTIKFSIGCGGGGYPPSMEQYFTDAGYSGNPITLRWLTKGFLHSMNCIGIGLRMVDFNGNMLWEQANLKRAVISPDGTRAVAVLQGDMQGDPSAAGDAVVLIDLATGTTTTLFKGTAKSIERVGWSSDGAQVLYNTKRSVRTAVGNANVQLGSQVFIDWPHTAETFTLELFRIAPIANSTPSLVATFEGYGVGNIAASVNSLFTAVSITSSDVPVVEKLNAGGTLTDLTPLRSKVSIYAVSANGSSQLSIPEGAMPVYGTALQFVAVPATKQTSAPLNPPTLVVGGQATVNVKAGDAINIRESASLNANVIKTLSRGAVVTITGTAVEAEGLRWWPVRVEPTGETGWAVDQVTTNGVTEFTLLPK